MRLYIMIDFKSLSKISSFIPTILSYIHKIYIYNKYNIDFFG